uniref:Uncharacterized protein n=1 Tax=Psilocybe cubensis TaxID=181762 RepID=A0A8H8CKX3_PSICU
MVTRTRNKSKAIDIHNHNPPRIDKMNKVDPEIRQFLDMEAQVDEGVDLEEDESARGSKIPMFWCFMLGSSKRDSED